MQAPLQSKDMDAVCWYRFHVYVYVQDEYIEQKHIYWTFRPFFGVVTNRLFSHFEILAKEDFTIFNQNYRILYRLPYYVT